MKGGQSNEPVGGGAQPGEGDAGVAVSEELLERAGRGDDAARCLELEERVAQLEGELASAREALDASERRRQIELALVDSDAVDLEVARLLTEATVSQMDEPDVALAIEELRGRKPYLFRSGGGGGGARGPGMRPAEAGGVDNGLDGLAEEARATGDRRALLRYLRQRRGV